MKGFGRGNTLLVEAELRKARGCQDLTLVPSEYTRADVLSRRQGRTLHELRAYLDEVLLPAMQVSRRAGLHAAD